MIRYLPLLMLALMFAGCKDETNSVPDPYLPEFDTIEGTTDAYRRAFIANDLDLINQVCMPDEAGEMRKKVAKYNIMAKDKNLLLDVEFSSETGSTDGGKTRWIFGQFKLVKDTEDTEDTEEAELVEYINKEPELLAFVEMTDGLWKYSMARSKAQVDVNSAVFDTFDNAIAAFAKALTESNPGLMARACLPSDQEHMWEQVYTLNNTAQNNNASIEVNFEGDSGTADDGNTQWTEIKILLKRTDGKSAQIPNSPKLIAFVKDDKDQWCYSSAKTAEIGKSLAESEKPSED